MDELKKSRQIQTKVSDKLTSSLSHKVRVGSDYVCPWVVFFIHSVKNAAEPQSLVIFPKI